MRPATNAPVFAGLYPELAEIARGKGYAMAVHGTLGRDMDLVCVPWIADPAPPQDVVDAILGEFAMQTVRGDPVTREHRRLVYTLTIAAPECFIDLSFTPASTPASEPTP